MLCIILKNIQLNRPFGILMKKNNSIKKINLIIGGAIGNCVHTAGVYNFLRIAEASGYKSLFLGAAVSSENFVKFIRDNNPDIVCISYRLTPSGLPKLLDTFFRLIKENNKTKNTLFYFGGTPKCVEEAKKYKYFSHFFQGDEKRSFIEKTLFFETKKLTVSQKYSKRDLLKNKNIGYKETKNFFHNKNYLPMIRHHFGLPSLSQTIEGIKKIANSELIDVISLAPDQNAQEFFFEPEKIDTSLDGTGGTPIRSENDLIKIYEASQTGNYPMLRIYAGTKNLLKWANISVKTINNAWGTIPLFWYSELDGRSKRTLEKAITENMETIKWYAERDIPVEINDSHQWALRECSDVTSVTDFYIAAYNAKKLGVKKFIAQLMFNTPRLTSAKMDLAKMLAKIELINELEDDNFIYFKQVRAGLTHFSVDMDTAKGQLSSSTLLALAVNPQIIHVVGFCEGDHAATAEEVIESCKIVKGVLKNCWQGFPDLTADKEVINRKNHLIQEAKKTLRLINNIFSDYSQDPLSNPKCLTGMVKAGIMDAPFLKGNPVALGQVKTMPINGGYEIIDNNNKIIQQSDYISRIIESSDINTLFLSNKTKE